MSGSTSGYHTHAYPRPSVSSSTSPRPSNVDSHTRQVSHTQGVLDAFSGVICNSSTCWGNYENSLEETYCWAEEAFGSIRLVSSHVQRVDLEKSRHRFVITSDVRHQILLMNQKAKEEWDKKQAEESDKLRKVNEVILVRKQANKEEDDKMRATAANVAARAAAGGDDMLSKWQLMAEQARQKRDGIDGASGSQLGKSAGGKSLSSSGRGSKEKQEFEKKGSSAFGTSGKYAVYHATFSICSLTLILLQI
ncbi:hypothetical protein BHM03_00049008 [Ensete ventricosum]|nr:hypothetical protein BHM03_00049008 [Ensete ventricosum]